MGSVADKIAQKVLAYRGSQAADLAVWQEVRKIALETGFDGKGPLPARLFGVEPCHGLYALTHHIALIMSEPIFVLREAKGYVRIVGDAQDEYLPAGPPMSPLTDSYFSLWKLFDVRFGSSRETMGSCILRILSEFDSLPWLVDILELMHRSRMGFFVHCGNEEAGVRLREVGTAEVISGVVPAGYAGSKGEIWFARVLPPPHPLCRRHVVLTTPYVIRDWPERAFVDYLERELTKMKARKRPPRTDDLRGELLKYGPEPNYWNEYIFCAYTNYQQDVVFLTGVPDRPESLPHAPADR